MGRRPQNSFTATRPLAWRATVSLQCQTGALRSPYNSNWHVTVSLQFKLARYGLLTIQTGALRSPYNSNCVLRHFYEWILHFCLRRPQAPPEPDLVGFCFFLDTVYHIFEQKPLLSTCITRKSGNFIDFHQNRLRSSRYSRYETSGPLFS